MYRTIIRIPTPPPLADSEIFGSSSGFEPLQCDVIKYPSRYNDTSVQTPSPGGSYYIYFVIFEQIFFELHILKITEKSAALATRQVILAPHQGD